MADDLAYRAEHAGRRRTGRSQERGRQRDAQRERREREPQHRNLAPRITATRRRGGGSVSSAHRAVLPRCAKKFTSPGAAPTMSAAAPETSAAMRPRAA